MIYLVFQTIIILPQRSPFLMNTTNYKKFKGEIESYLKRGHNNFESRIDGAFSSLKMKTWLSRTHIVKKDGYHAAHLLFILTVLPLLKIKTVGSFCKKHWHHWSESRKDTFYRFKHGSYRWRSFMVKVNREITKTVGLEKHPLEDRYFVIDDTIVAKLGKKIENVSYIFDHNRGYSVLGFCIVTLGLFTGESFYPLDFAYRFGKKRHPKSSEEIIGDPRSISGQRSFEAKHYSKLQLALMMIQRAINCGFSADYVLFDSWYAWPVVIHGIRKMNRGLHVICRLKESNVRYQYQGKKYKLSELYQKVKHGFKRDARTALLLKRITVKLPESNEEAVIVFSKGYTEPQVDSIKGKNKKKEPKWVAFLCTNTKLHAATIIKKYIKRWPIEVCFKECKQMLELGKDQSNCFNAQVFATTASFIRYNLLNFLNEKDNHATMGSLFEQLVDDSAVITYSQRLWAFFRGLFLISYESIFNLFKIEDNFQSYIDALDEVLQGVMPIQGCET